MALFLLATAILLSCKKENSCEECKPENRSPVALSGPDLVTSLPADSVWLNGNASYDPDGRITRWQWRKVSGPASYIIIHPDSAGTAVRSLSAGLYLFELSVTDDKGSSAKDTVQVTVNPIGTLNRPPVACAGPDLAVTLPVNSVQINGSCSSDPDGNITGYQWTKISGPASISVVNPTAVQTQVSNLTEGTFWFELKVTDAGGLFSKDTVQLTVNPTVTVEPADVYVTGMENSAAKYWKNGQGFVLPVSGQVSGGSVATSIAVSGNDVYIAGYEGDDFVYTSNRAVYWKNGQEIMLTGPTGAGTTSIAVAGNDVYVTGWELNGNKTVAKYWKNGQPFALTNVIYDAEATCVVVVNNDVYISGHENGVAKYWKNGQPVILTDGSQQAYANSIAVAGNDVYVAGSESNGTAHVAKYWKNGQAIPLSNGSEHASATSITVSGTDVYVSGYEGDYYHSVAKYWKNGQAYAITNGVPSYARSIAVHNGNVYVAGYDSGPNYFSAKYWKNGQPVTLTPANGSWAIGIAVVPR